MAFQPFYQNGGAYFLDEFRRRKRNIYGQRSGWQYFPSLRLFLPSWDTQSADWRLVVFFLLKKRSLLNSRRMLLKGPLLVVLVRA